MGQKVNPIGFRTGITKEWKFCWFDRNNEYGSLVGISSKVKFFLNKFYTKKSITEVKMEYNFGTLVVFITCQNVGIVIGEKGAKINEVTTKLEKICGCQVQIFVNRERQNAINASSLALTVSSQINQRVSYKRAIKQVINTVEGLKLPGIKVIISGRLGGAEIARRERFISGRIPAHTLRSNIDYNCCNIDTTYGTLGLKVWLYKGDVYERPKVLLTTSRKNDKEAKNK